MKNFNIQDESGDRKYFTQLPNMIVNHSTAYEQSLYWIMKRLAGEGGNCYASLNFLSEKMGIDKKTVTKTIDRLLKRKWIKEVELTKVKGGYTRTFTLIDLWKINMNNYRGGDLDTTSKGGGNFPQGGRQILRGGCQKDTSNSKSNIYNKTLDKNKLQRLNELKQGLIKSKVLPGRTEAQEEASGIIRSSSL